MPYPYKKEIIREQRDERVGGSEEIDERDNNKENTNKNRKIESAGSDLAKIEIKEVRQEVVRKEIVHVPIATDDLTILDFKERSSRKKESEE